MDWSPAAREAWRIGRPKADRTLKCASSLPVRGRLECPEMDVQLVGELIEWQKLVLSLVVSDRCSGTLQYGDGNNSSAAIEWSVGLDGNRQERGELPLPQTNRPTQLAELIHHCGDDAMRCRCRKATSGLHDRRSR
jgi:hypothetical protein